MTCFFFLILHHRRYLKMVRKGVIGGRSTGINKQYFSIFFWLHMGKSFNLEFLPEMTLKEGGEPCLRLLLFFAHVGVYLRCFHQT